MRSDSSADAATNRLREERTDSSGVADSGDSGGTSVTRRELLCGAAGAVALCAVGGIGLASANSSLLRPPGAPDEQVFLGLCLRCDRCRSACPHDVIVVASMEDGFVNMRTPKLDFHEGYCDFCGSKEDADAYPQCVVHCPTGALQDEEWPNAIIGLARIDTEECIAYTNRAACRVCVDECPYGAVSLDDSSRPVVNESLCNGCGRCEYKCPSHSYRSFSGSANRGIYVRLDRA